MGPSSMTQQTRSQVERLAVKGAVLSVLLSSLAIGLLIWGKLQLKEVPRTAEAQPEATQPAPQQLQLPPTKTQIVQPARTLPQVEKSHNQPADDRGADLSTGSSLVLENTILGDRPQATINGVTVEVGQQVDGYVLQGVTQDRVVLEKDGVEVHLTK